MAYLKQNHFIDLFDLENEKNFELKRLSSKAMQVKLENGIIKIGYINTVVFQKNGQKNMVLNTNSWETVTSKKWINYGLSSFGFGRVFQKDFTRYFENTKTNKTELYTDKMQIDF